MKKLLFTLAIGIAMLTSCTEDHSTITTPPSDEGGVLLKRDVISNTDGSVNNTSDYTYDGNKITKIVNVSEFGTETTIYTYTNDLLTSIEEQLLDPMSVLQTDIIVLEYDSNDRVIKETVLMKLVTRV
ncbi:MAG: hypothetical protein COA88_01365 [Kordia sp.]|nr:MAG: hypothetical protein COA88_01365 [Kordia sp.]